MRGFSVNPHSRTTCSAGTHFAAGERSIVRHGDAVEAGYVNDAAAIFTIGHSTRPVAEFVAMLLGHDVRKLVDVRTIPRSRHNPQFNADALAAALSASNIDYVPMRSLGGLRRAKPDSINTGWRNESFRGYADYMQTPAFAAAIDELVGIAESGTTAIMCAEAVPWRCHRSLVADALVVRGVPVAEIVSEARTAPHLLTSFARVEGGRISYPPEDTLF